MSDRSLRAIAHLLLLHTDDEHMDSHPSLSLTLESVPWFEELPISLLYTVGRFSEAISSTGIAVFARPPLLGNSFAKKEKRQKPSIFNPSTGIASTTLEFFPPLERTPCASCNSQNSGLQKHVLWSQPSSAP